MTGPTASPARGFYVPLTAITRRYFSWPLRCACFGTVRCETCDQAEFALRRTDCNLECETCIVAYVCPCGHVTEDVV
jgi:hypothetical protein